MPFLLCFEGASGSGKSTAVNSMIDRLNKSNIKTVDIRPQLQEDTVPSTVRTLTHPVEINLTPQQEVLLYSTRLAHKKKLIDNCKDCDVIVIDRYHLSIIVLGHYVRHLSRKQILDVVEFAIDGQYPNLTVILDTDYHTYLDRQKKQPGEKSRKEQGGKEVMENYFVGFREEARRTLHSTLVLDSRQFSSEKLVDLVLRSPKLQQILPLSS